MRARFLVIGVVVAALVILWRVAQPSTPTSDHDEIAGREPSAESRIGERPIVTALTKRQPVWENESAMRLRTIGWALEDGRRLDLKDLQFFINDSEKYFPLLEDVVAQPDEPDRSAALVVLMTLKKLYRSLPPHQAPPHRKHAIEYRFRKSTEDVLKDPALAPLYREFDQGR